MAPKDPFVINLKKPEDSPQQIADKLNTLHSSIDISVIKGALSRDEFDKYKGKTDKIVSGYEDRVNYNIERGTKKLTDMRYHGAGAGINSVGATSPITSSGGSAPNISTSIHTGKLVGRGSGGIGVMEEITLGTNLSLIGTTLNASGGGGSGTVTDLSVVTANGVSGSVANSTTTPAITITLGAITPTSVAAVGGITGSAIQSLSGNIISAGTLVASGTVTGSNLSGTNTGDQNLFASVVASGQTTVTANSTTTPLTLVAGSNITLTTNNTAKSVTIASTGGGTPASPTTSVQFNDSGSFGGDINLYWDKTNKILNLGQGGGSPQAGIIQSAVEMDMWADYSVTRPSVSLTPDSISLGYNGSGASTVTSDGGSVNINANSGGETSGAGGSINITAGSAQGGDSDGGSVNIRAGQEFGGGGAGSIFIIGSSNGDVNVLGTQSSTGGRIRLKTNDSLGYATLVTQANNQTFTFPNQTGTFVVDVGTADLTAQTAAKTATTLFTPSITGMYRISVYLQVTTAASISSVLGGASGVVLTYNDGDGNVAQTDTVALMNTAGGIAITSSTNTTATNLNGTVVIYAKTGVAIQYAIGYTSAGTAMQYAAHLRCELI